MTKLILIASILFSHLVTAQPVQDEFHDGIISAIIESPRFKEIRRELQKDFWLNTIIVGKSYDGLEDVIWFEYKRPQDAVKSRTNYCKFGIKIKITKNPPTAEKGLHLSSSFYDILGDCWE